VDYPKLAKADPELAEELLPEGTSYDPANNWLIREGLRQQIIVLKLSSIE